MVSDVPVDCFLSGLADSGFNATLTECIIKLIHFTVIISVPFLL